MWLKNFCKSRTTKSHIATDGDVAWHQFMKNIYDVCLLDIMLPGKKDGMELANNIRKKNENIPIIMLTSKNMDNDKIAGFESGADDYVTKPYNLHELLLRIQVFLKRSKKKEDSGPGGL